MLCNLDYVIETLGTAIRLLLPRRFLVYHGPRMEPTHIVIHLCQVLTASNQQLLMPMHEEYTLHNHRQI
jgi:hypothetical protein